MPFPFVKDPVSKLCLLDGRSSSPFPVASLRFLLSEKAASALGGRRSLTILVLFCLEICFVIGAGVAAAAAGRDCGTTLGRGEGPALGRGDGAVLEGLEGTLAPLAVFVRIFGFGAGGGTGDDMAGSVFIGLEILTVGFGFAWAGSAEAGVETLGGTNGVLVTDVAAGADAGVAAFGIGAGVAFGVGAGVAAFGVGAGGATTFFGCIKGTSGVDARESG